MLSSSMMLLVYEEVRSCYHRRCLLHLPMTACMQQLLIQLDSAWAFNPTDRCSAADMVKVLNTHLIGQ